MSLPCRGSGTVLPFPFPFCPESGSVETIFLGEAALSPWVPE